MTRKVLFIALAAVTATAQAQSISVGADGSVSIKDGQAQSISVGSNGAVNISTGGQDVRVATQPRQKATSGVKIVNDKVWIDGIEVPRGLRTYQAPSGKVYKIDRQGSAVSVTERLDIEDD